MYGIPFRTMPIDFTILYLYKLANGPSMMSLDENKMFRRYGNKSDIDAEGFGQSVQLQILVRRQENLRAIQGARQIIKIDCRLCRSGDMREIPDAAGENDDIGCPLLREAPKISAPLVSFAGN